MSVLFHTLKIADTTDSLSLTTGALQVSGGLSITKNLSVGGSFNIPNALFSGTGDSSITTTGGITVGTNMIVGNTLTINNPSTSNFNSALTVFLNGMSNGNIQYISLGKALTNNNIAQFGFNYAGPGNAGNYAQIALYGATNSLNVYNDRCSIVGNLTVGGTSALNGITTVSASTGDLLILKSTNATGKNDIIFQNTTNGKIGYVGLDGTGLLARVQDALTVYSPTGKPLQLFSDTATIIIGTNDSNATTTGALQIAGGIGVVKNIVAGGEIISTIASGSAIGQFRAVSGNYGMFLRNDGTNFQLMSTASGSPYGTHNANRPFSYTFATNSLTSDSPWVFQNTTASTSVSTGAVKVSGGVGITGALNVGTTISVNDASTSYAIFSMTGPDSNIAGPHATYYTSSDATYPIFQQLNWAHDNICLNFDCYHNGTNHQSASITGNAIIYKTNGQLQFKTAKGITAGSNISTFVSSSYIDLASGKTVFAAPGSAGLAGKVNIQDINGTAVGIYFATTQVGSITCSSTSSAFNTTSDYRLKENLTPLVDAAIRLQKLKTYRFNFKNNPDFIVDGFIAHEVGDLVPEAVSGVKDALDNDGKIIPQGIDHSKLVPLLTAALQEAFTEINNLKTRVKILENK